jgi:two-component system, OmpR family, copper resistance phosphate regulon response regulator CusR
MIGSTSLLEDVARMRILIVEDEAKVAAALTEGLGREGYEVVVAPTGEDGFFRATDQRFDLVLLDVMLPGRDGFEVLRALRKRAVDTPILMLTARDSVEDRIIGLDGGADDYLVKPFAFPELLARVRAILRRGTRQEVQTSFEVADLRLDVVAREATRAGTSLELTVREFQILEYLLRHQGHIVSREMLARDVWKERGRATSLDNVIDVHMARLRKKVDQDSSATLIHTVRGVGFVLREDPG